MKRLLFFFLFIVLVALVLFRVADQPGDYADGTRIDGVNVSGMGQQEAIGALRKELSAKEIRVFVDGRPLTISPDRLDLQPRIEKALSLAEQGQPGGLQRALGLGEGPEVAVSWRYRKSAIAEELNRLRDRVARTPREARFFFTGSEIKTRPGRSGRSLQNRGLEEKLHQAAMAGGGTVLARTRQEEPRLRDRRDLERRYPELLLVDKSDFTVTLYRRLRFDRSYPVAIGMPGFDTPEGWFRINGKSVDPAWLPPDWAGSQAGQLVPGGTPENPLVSRWLGIADGVGIHGTRDTWSLGSAASHGCLRMDPDQVIELYDLVPNGTPILIRA